MAYHGLISYCKNEAGPIRFEDIYSCGIIVYVNLLDYPNILYGTCDVVMLFPLFFE